MYQLSVFSPLSSWKKGDYPVAPFVHISVDFHSEEEDGRILLSPQLVTDNEVDNAVDALIRELEAFRKAAKKELRLILTRQLEK